MLLSSHDPRMGRESPHLFFSYLVGDYVGNSLANQRVILKTRFLKIILVTMTIVRDGVIL